MCDVSAVQGHHRRQEYAAVGAAKPFNSHIEFRGGIYGSRTWDGGLGEVSVLHHSWRFLGELKLIWRFRRSV